MGNKRILPDKVNDYVAKVTWLSNVVLLLCHFAFGAFFLINDFTILFVFNCFSILTYFATFGLLKKKMARTYVIIVFVEIYLFMLVAIACVGWDYGFQHYCISFIASLLFSDFYMNGTQKDGKKTILLGSINAVLYIALRFWTDVRPPIYHLENDYIVYLIYLLNTLTGFAFLIMFLYIYSRTVHKLERDLRQMAERDPLTGLYNRRKMLQFLDDAVKDVKNRAFAVAMLDIDYFKKVNDTYGHDAGDEVLTYFAKTLDNYCSDKENYAACRWGGEEFLILYRYHTSEEAVVEEFETLRRQIEESTLVYEEKHIKITTTIGLRICKECNEVNAIIKEVDDLLYEGKTAGRNRVMYKM